MKRRQTGAPAGRQRGLSLIELMVASVISLLIMSAVLTLYLNLSRANDEMAKTNALIENGRFAIQVVQADLLHAGFWNGYIPQFDDLTASDIPSDVPDDIPAPCEVFSSWTAQDRTNLLGIPLQVYAGVPAGCGAIVTDRKEGTDVLVVRHADTCAAGAANCAADVSGPVYFQASFCDSETAEPYVLDTSGFTLQRRNCTTIAEKRRYVANLYYIRDYAVTPGDGIPTLMRSQFGTSTGATPENQQQPATALIEGIEGFAVTLGIDDVSDSGAAVDYTAAVTWADESTRTSPTNRGDGTPDGAFVRCTEAVPCSMDQLMNAVAAKIEVLVRSRDATPGYSSSKTYSLGGTTYGPFTDSYKRHVFSTTVRLNNVSGRRATP
ncbi:Type IV Pilus-assembly protein W [compost metagenome]